MVCHLVAGDSVSSGRLFFLGVKSFFFELEFIRRSCFVTKKTLSVFLSFLGVFCGVLLVKCVFIKHD